MDPGKCSFLPPRHGSSHVTSPPLPRPGTGCPVPLLSPRGAVAADSRCPSAPRSLQSQFPDLCCPSAPRCPSWSTPPSLLSEPSSAQTPPPDFINSPTKPMHRQQMCPSLLHLLEASPSRAVPAAGPRGAPHGEGTPNPSIPAPSRAATLPAAPWRDPKRWGCSPHTPRVHFTPGGVWASRKSLLLHSSGLRRARQTKVMVQV